MKQGNRWAMAMSSRSLCLILAVTTISRINSRELHVLVLECLYFSYLILCSGVDTFYTSVSVSAESILLIDSDQSVQEILFNQATDQTAVQILMINVLKFIL